MLLILARLDRIKHSHIYIVTNQFWYQTNDYYIFFMQGRDRMLMIYLGLQCTSKVAYGILLVCYPGDIMNMMTSSNGNIFRVTGHLCGEFTGHRWIPRTKVSDAELWFFFDCAWINDWVNNREAGDLRRHRRHYDVNVMNLLQCSSYFPYFALNFNIMNYDFVIGYGTDYISLTRPHWRQSVCVIYHPI